MPNYGWGLDPQDEVDDQSWVIPGLIPADDGIADEYPED
jgi:hypothetical protein